MHNMIICLSVYMSIYLSIYLSICRSFLYFLYVCISVYLSVCLSVCLSTANLVWPTRAICQGTLNFVALPSPRPDSVLPT